MPGSNRQLLLVALCLILPSWGSAQEAEEAATAGPAPLAESFTAVHNATVWPNLTLLPDGSFLLAGFDQPSHGQVEGDVACWYSKDGGRSWNSRATITEHEPSTVRMNHAVGLDRHGNVIALVGGWTDVQQPDAPKRNKFRDAILGPWIMVSEDQGETWNKVGDFPADPLGRPFVVFGDIVLSGDGRLNASAYSTSYWDHPDPWAAYFLTSADDGMTWEIRSKILENGNETALLHLGDGEWLAAIRGKTTTLHRSVDDGESWVSEGDVSEERQYPAHLLKLDDDRILLTYGDRRADNLGVGVRLSVDEGKTWGEPIYLAAMPQGDGGYPASLQRKDGKICTVFYAQDGDTYTAEAVIWEAPQKRRPAA